MKKKNNSTFLVVKPFGLTPLATLNLLREEKPEYKNSVLSYAGRLDPMATGLLLVLVDEANKEREKYLGLNKEYEFEILFGFETDTGDLLGRVVECKNNPSKLLTLSKEVDNFFTNKLGTFVQKYPKYSSPVLDGKENFTKEVEIFSASVMSEKTYSRQELSEMILKKLEEFIILNPGENFRQSEILSNWQKVLSALPAGENFAVAKVRLACSSGTYLRVLAPECGRALGLPACVFSLRRTAIGEHKVLDAWKLQGSVF